MAILKRIVWNMFPPTELRQFSDQVNLLLNSGDFQPPLHAPNPLIPIRKHMLSMLENPELIVSEIRQFAIPVEHFVLLKIHQIALNTLNSGKFREYGYQLNAQGTEYMRLIRKVVRLMEQRGYSLYSPNLRISIVSQPQ